MFWIIWTYLLGTAFFTWLFYSTPEQDMDREILTAYGKAVHTLFVIGAAGCWPVMLPYTLIDRYRR